MQDATLFQSCNTVETPHDVARSPLMAIDTLALDPDGTLAASLEEGATLPASWYGDPAILEREQERIFRSAWQYAGPAARVSEPGEFVTCLAGRIPVVVVRDRDGELRAFVNVCRHRGHLVAEGEGRRETLQCPYHAWTYGLDGCLRRAPRSEREPGFDPSDLSLLPVRAEAWGPFVFVNPDLEADSFAETFPELSGLVERSGVDLSSLELRSRRDWESPVNWKLGVENYLECYHCPVAHPGFSRVVDVDPDSYALETFELFSSQLAPVRPAALTGGDGVPYDARGEVAQAQFHFLWPNTAFNIEPGRTNLAVMSWRPLEPRRTHGRYDYFFGSDVPEESARELMEFSRSVGEEDRSLVESVQRGLDSGSVPHGRLLPESERLIQHFQRLFLQAVA